MNPIAEGVDNGVVSQCVQATLLLYREVPYSAEVGGISEVEWLRPQVTGAA